MIALKCLHQRSLEMQGVKKPQTFNIPSILMGTKWVPTNILLAINTEMHFRGILILPII